MRPLTTDPTRRPRVGVVTMAFPGYYLGEEMAQAKHAEMLAHLRVLELEPAGYDPVVLDAAAARQAGRELAGQGLDLLCIALATFVPDHYLVELLDECDLPVFLWAIEREINCLSLVGGLLINPTLYELGKHYQSRWSRHRRCPGHRAPAELCPCGDAAPGAAPDARRLPRQQPRHHVQHGGGCLWPQAGVGGHKWCHCAISSTRSGRPPYPTMRPAPIGSRCRGR